MRSLLCVFLAGCLWFAPARAATAVPSPQTELLELTAAYAAAATAGDAAKMAAVRHPQYTGAALAARALAAPAETTVRIVGTTAVVAGGTAGAAGSFMTTWVRENDRWLLLAEHWAATGEPDTRSVSGGPAKPVVATTEPVPPEAAQSGRATDEVETRARSGLLPERIRQLFRAYEPNQVGYTHDRGDDAFLDFTVSLMFPLHPGAYPPGVRTATGGELGRALRYDRPQLYFAATQRAGQYIGTRPSSPVVGKRFNPLLALRFWALRDGQGRERESEDNFLEFVFGHESNGQFIASEARFREQLRVYLNQAEDTARPDLATLARNTAYLSARDNISRGWDYVGVQFARDWDAELPWTERDVTMALRAKFNYWLPTGPLQGDAEEYNAWEADPDGAGKARKSVDGLSLRWSLIVDEPVGRAKRWFDFERRYAVTWQTGYTQPLRYNTFKAEAGVRVFGLPVMVWYRYGYNSDLIDYYRKDHSAGATLSFWKF